MSEPNNHVSDAERLPIDMAKSQFERLSAWSQFYHDAEIKVNTNTLIVSAAGMLIQNYGNNLFWDFRLFKLNLVGLLIILSSLAGLVSTIGYWRYYEFCDLYAKKIRDSYFPRDHLRKIQQNVESKFEREFPILSRGIFVNAHHAVWIVAQIFMLSVGLMILLKPVTVTAQ